MSRRSARVKSEVVEAAPAQASAAAVAAPAEASARVRRQARIADGKLFRWRSVADDQPLLPSEDPENPLPAPLFKSLNAEESLVLVGDVMRLMLAHQAKGQPTSWTTVRDVCVRNRIAAGEKNLLLQHIAHRFRVIWGYELMNLPELPAEVANLVHDALGMAGSVAESQAADERGAAAASSSSSSSSSSAAARKPRDHASVTKVRDQFVLVCRSADREHDGELQQARAHTPEQEAQRGLLMVILALVLVSDLRVSQSALLNFLRRLGVDKNHPQFRGVEPLKLVGQWASQRYLRRITAARQAAAGGLRLQGGDDAEQADMASYTLGERVFVETGIAELYVFIYTVLLGKELPAHLRARLEHRYDLPKLDTEEQAAFRYAPGQSGIAKAERAEPEDDEDEDQGPEVANSRGSSSRSRRQAAMRDDGEEDEEEPGSRRRSGRSHRR